MNTPTTPKWSWSQLQQLCRQKDASSREDTPTLAGVWIPYPFGLVGATIHLAPCADEARSLTILRAHDPDPSCLEVVGDDVESLAVDLLVKDVCGEVIRRCPLEERIEIVCIPSVLRERLFFPIGNNAFQVSMKEGERLLTALARIEIVLDGKPSLFVREVTRDLAPKLSEYPRAPHERLDDLCIEGIRVTFGLPVEDYEGRSFMYGYLGWWTNRPRRLERLRDFIQLAPLG